MPAPLSVLDLAPISSGHTAADALHNTLDLARRVEALGYQRYWVAEHHLTPGVAAASPAVLLALIAAATTRIRVGSAAVLLGQHSPLTVTEQFGTIAQVHPGRVDLGLGRSGRKRTSELTARFAETDEPPAADRIVDGLVVPPKPPSYARSENVVARLKHQLSLVGAPAEELGYRAQVERVLAFLNGEHPGPDGQPVQANPAEGADLDVWILGSSGGESAVTAGELGLPFGANYHVSPATILETVAAYREAFTPSVHLARPYLVVSADVLVADTDEAASELAGPFGAWVHSIRAGSGAIPFPAPAEAATFAWDDTATEIVADRLSTRFVGTPEHVVRRLSALQRVTGADELVITTITHDHADRVRSYELLAKAWFEG